MQRSLAFPTYSLAFSSTLFIAPDGAGNRCQHADDATRPYQIRSIVTQNIENANAHIISPITSTGILQELRK